MQRWNWRNWKSGQLHQPAAVLEPCVTMLLCPRPDRATVDAGAGFPHLPP
ncbi:MAG: hypothetical protein OQJ97_14290 [Rhodospirillales bacterium]|nr:hypothetical protein [Rhodospirillales bacterium]